MDDNMYFLVVNIFIVLSYTRASVVTDVTSEVFSGTSSDLLAAFGDFNANKITDLFVLSNNGMNVDVLLGDEKVKKFKRKSLINETTSYITGVVPGDFDGDLQTDLLVTVASDNAVTVEIYWNNNNEIVGSTIIPEIFKDAPLVLDWNADMIPDFICETLSGDLVVWEAKRNERNFTKVQIVSDVGLHVPHSNAFLDLNDDFSPDLFLTKEDCYEEMFNVAGSLTLNTTKISLPSYIKDSEEIMYKYRGQTSFADFDQDSKMDLMVPVCRENTGNSCTDSAVVMYFQEKWMVISESFKNGDVTWEFVTEKDNRASAQLQNKQVVPATLRMGDFNMDGYPDALAILQATVNNKQVQSAFLLINEECHQHDEFCQRFKRKLVVQWDSQFSTISGAVMATFFDLYEDGILDILLVAVTEGKPILRAYKNIFTSDACFVKITVVSGLCSKECPDDREPFGASNQPGPYIKYETVTPKGKPQKSCAAQLSQSAHFALQLPYTVFGLGQTPNFVDKLSVSIPHHSTHQSHRQWTQIIPNSQLVVIPYPNNEPSSWALHLYVTPSRLIYITGAVLLGTIGFVAGIVGILHLRERREDKVEKQQESQKFHFDAM